MFLSSYPSQYRLLLVITTLIQLTGCVSMAPDYNRPAAPVPQAWPDGPTYKKLESAASDKAVPDIPWQDFFIDQRLRKVIALTLENNRDLRIAARNIERSQAQYQIRRSELMPKVNASAGGNFQRVPEDFTTSGNATTTRQYSAGLGVSSYELDLFGRVQSLKDQALLEYLATEQAKRSVQISLVAQVASAYLTIASDLERFRLANETLASQQASYKLIRSRYEAGVSNALDLRQAQTAVDSARVDIARLTSVVAQDQNALNLVVGSTVPSELLPTALSEQLTSLKEITHGTPSEVLLQRPDVILAENRLKGFNANIGAARAAFFPRISLVSSAGFGSSELGGLFKSGSFAWSFVPNISLPVFDGGSNSANLKVAEADRDIAVAQYEKAIQTAFREVADALARRGTIDEQLTAQQSLVEAANESNRLAMARYEKGVDSYLAVLDSQRSLYAAEQNLIGVQLDRLTNLITVYKALGGGGEGGQP